jgi:hypothetical protein
MFVGSESSHLGSSLNQLLQTAKVVPAVNQVEYVSLFGGVWRNHGLILR